MPLQLEKLYFLAEAWSQVSNLEALQGNQFTGIRLGFALPDGGNNALAASLQIIQCQCLPQNDEPFFVNDQVPHGPATFVLFLPRFLSSNSGVGAVVKVQSCHQFSWSWEHIVVWQSVVIYIICAYLCPFYVPDLCHCQWPTCCWHSACVWFFPDSKHQGYVRWKLGGYNDIMLLESILIYSSFVSKRGTHDDNKMFSIPGAGPKVPYLLVLS